MDEHDWFDSEGVWHEEKLLTGDTSLPRVRKLIQRVLGTPGREASLVVHTKLISHGVDLDQLALAIRDEAHHYECRFKDPARDEETARKRLRSAADTLRGASTGAQRRSAVQEFLSALAELILCLLRFMIRVLLALLSRLLGRVITDDVPGWTAEPIDATPQIAPRGPNPAPPLRQTGAGITAAR